MTTVVDTSVAHGQFFSLSYLARAARIALRTAQTWKAKGIIPEATFRCAIRGWDVYSFAQLEALVFAVRAKKRKELKLRDVGPYLRERWTPTGDRQ